MGDHMYFQSGATHWGLLQSGWWSAGQAFIAGCWVFVADALLFLLGLIKSSFLRFWLEKTSKSKELCNHDFDDGIASMESLSIEKTEERGSMDEDPSSGFSFKFPGKSPEEIRRAVEEMGNDVGGNACSFCQTSTPTTTVQTYRFLGVKDFTGFVQEPDVVSLSEGYVQTRPNQISSKELRHDKDVHGGTLTGTDFGGNTSTGEDKSAEEEAHCRKAAIEEVEEVTTSEQIGVESDFFLDVGRDSPIFEQQSSNELNKPNLIRTKFLYQRDFFPSCEEADSDDDQFINNIEVEEQSSNGSTLEEKLMLLEGEVLTNPHGEETETHVHDRRIRNEEETELIQSSRRIPSFGLGGDKDISTLLLEERESETDSNTTQEKVELVEETQKIEDAYLPSPCKLDLNVDEEMIERKEELSDCEKTDQDSNTKDDSNLESLWEHQDLVEQLKMELRKVRIGLPTIFEESESPELEEDPIPWKFEEKFLQEDPMDELQKFYKSYRERMRKFDILNYQKMYTIGFLNLKDQLPRIYTRRRNTIPSLLLPYNFRLCRPKKSNQHPLNHLTMELHNDLETVYVGQTCLSWEFLQWQHAKASAMLDVHPHKHRPFNTFVAELQQFQVLIQRFLENETFQGPRVHNYVKTRCVLRSLIQVPSLGEDPKDREEASMRRLRGEEAGATSAMVVKMIGDSMRVFWDFVHADKEEVAKGMWFDQNEFVSNPSDQTSKLISEVRMELNKKERKLKGLNRASQCLVKRLQKQQGAEEGRENQEAFMAQVDMRLVSRVLMMSKPTEDQLTWCQKKLNRISISGRRVHREQSFLLFPC